MAWILHCCDCGLGWQLQLQFTPGLQTSICFRCGPKKEKSHLLRMGVGREGKVGIAAVASQKTNQSFQMCPPLKLDCAMLLRHSLVC